MPTKEKESARSVHQVVNYAAAVRTVLSARGVNLCLMVCASTNAQSECSTRLESVNSVPVTAKVVIRQQPTVLPASKGMSDLPITLVRRHVE